jgi:outer membrane protein OmpA-like peptidoglycan-associated protein
MRVVLLYSMIIFFSIGCVSTYKIDSGYKAYELKQYAKAIPMFLQEYDSITDKDQKGKTAFYLAKSYERVNDDANSLMWYEKAADLEANVDVYRDLAEAYKRKELYDRAIKAYQLWEQNGGSFQEARKQIDACKKAKQWLVADKQTIVEPMFINSPSSEYAPVIYDEDYIVFSSDRPGSKGSSVYEWTGHNFSDLYIIPIDGGQALSFNEKINSEHNEGVACFNSDFTEIYFTRCYLAEGDDFCRILWSFREGQGWSEPEEVFSMKPNVNYGHPTLVENDEVLVFSSNDPSGYGGSDLYYIVREEEGWSEPELMPASINTEGNEKFPRAEGENTLYFSSDNLPGLGGLDIFKTELNNGVWSDPINLKAPINSGSDDFSLVVDQEKISSDPQKEFAGYFSSSRAGVGNDDLFSFTTYVLPEDQKPKEVEETVVEEPTGTIDKEKAIFIAVRVVVKDYEDPENPNSLVIGKTPLNNADVTVKVNGKTENLVTDERGRIIINGEYESLYELSGKYEGYLSNSKEFSSPAKEELSGSETYNVELVLDRIFYNKEVVLEDIFYDFNKFFIRDDAKPSLDTLSQLMKDNPEIAILLSSHTDCIGRPEFNLELSDRRANAAADYLVSTGISPSRIAFKGFGESRPAIDCVCQLCTDEQRQKNRRTAFTILLE